MIGNDVIPDSAVLVAAILLLVLVGRFLSARIASRGGSDHGRPISGVLGGAVCPNCGRPFAIHLWSINLLFGRLDRCPHCGRWRLVRRATPDQLKEVLEALAVQTREQSPGPAEDDDALKRKLDESRFEDA